MTHFFGAVLLGLWPLWLSLAAFFCAWEAWAEYAKKRKARAGGYRPDTETASRLIAEHYIKPIKEAHEKRKTRTGQPEPPRR